MTDPVDRWLTPLRTLSRPLIVRSRFAAPAVDRRVTVADLAATVPACREPGAPLCPLRWAGVFPLGRGTYMLRLDSPQAATFQLVALAVAQIDLETLEAVEWAALHLVQDTGSSGPAPDALPVPGGPVTLPLAGPTSRSLRVAEDGAYAFFLAGSGGGIGVRVVGARGLVPPLLMRTYR